MTNWWSTINETRFGCKSKLFWGINYIKYYSMHEKTHSSLKVMFNCNAASVVFIFDTFVGTHILLCQAYSFELFFGCPSHAWHSAGKRLSWQPIRSTVRMIRTPPPSLPGPMWPGLLDRWDNCRHVCRAGKMDGQSGQARTALSGSSGAVRVGVCSMNSVWWFEKRLKRKESTIFNRNVFVTLVSTLPRSTYEYMGYSVIWRSALCILFRYLRFKNCFDYLIT